jgi:hypothetical protein
LIREDLDENPVPHPGVADKRFDRGDFHNGRTQAVLCADAAPVKG